jgi:hypothetical protein
LVKDGIVAGRTGGWQQLFSRVSVSIGFLSRAAHFPLQVRNGKYIYHMVMKEEVKVSITSPTKGLSFWGRSSESRLFEPHRIIRLWTRANEVDGKSETRCAHSPIHHSCDLRFLVLRVFVSGYRCSEVLSLSRHVNVTERSVKSSKWKGS